MSLARCLTNPSLTRVHGEWGDGTLKSVVVENETPEVTKVWTEGVCLGKILREGPHLWLAVPPEKEGEERTRRGGSFKTRDGAVGQLVSEWQAVRRELERAA